jgi:hypothetical protein
VTTLERSTVGRRSAISFSVSEWNSMWPAAALLSTENSTAIERKREEEERREEEEEEEGC